jgi:hypothetical protein
MTPLSPIAMSFAIAGALLLGLWTYHAAALAVESRPRRWPDVLVVIGTLVLTTYGSYLFAADLGRRFGTAALALLAVTIAVGARRGARRRG